MRIDVSDVGIGISEADQRRLFSKFFRADNSSTREVPGVGLGLYIVKHVVEPTEAESGLIAGMARGALSALLYRRSAPNPSAQRRRSKENRRRAGDATTRPDSRSRYLARYAGVR